MLRQESSTAATSTDEELARLYAGAAIFCCVSEAEGFGLPVLEAMSWGVPVIHSDCAALSEVAGGAGRSVRLAALNEELPVELSRLMDDEAERTRLGAAGRNRSLAFSWHEAARSTARLLGEVAAEWR